MGGARVCRPAKRRADWLERAKKITDYNDLHAAEGLHAVRTQIEGRILALGWRQRDAAREPSAQGAGDDVYLRPIDSIDELLERFFVVYGQSGTVFDAQEHLLLPMSDMRDICVTRELHRAWAEHPEKRIVRQSAVGFDPAGTDPSIACNLWAGWPTTPKAGRCENLIDLLRYMCAADKRPEDLFRWCLRWLAYPIQHPGAKMRTTIVVHGPQGTGKHVFRGRHGHLWALWPRDPTRRASRTSSTTGRRANCS